MKKITLLFLFALASLDTYSQKVDSVKVLWEEFCQKGFSNLSRWSTNQVNNPEHALKVTLANGIGALNLFNKKPDQQLLTQARLSNEQMKQFALDYPETYNLLIEAPCFRDNRYRLQDFVQEQDKNAVSTEIIETYNKDGINAPQIRAALPCDSPTIAINVGQEGNLIFTIRVLNCQVAKSTDGRFIPGVIPEPFRYVPLVAWFEDNWNKLGFAPNGRKHYFDLEFHGMADGIDVDGVLDFDFDLAIPAGTPYRKFDKKARLQNTPDTTIQYIGKSIPYYSSDKDKSNELLALGRAWSAFTAFKRLSNKPTSFVTIIHDLEDEDFRGVEIIIKSEVFLTELVSQRQKKYRKALESQIVKRKP